MPEIVLLAQEANRRSAIENRRWDGAIILGPAVMAPLENVQIVGSAFDAPPEALFIEVPEGRPVVGVVALRNVVFSDCQFQNIGVIGTAESIQGFRQAFTEASVAPGQPAWPPASLPSAGSASATGESEPGAPTFPPATS